MSLSTLADSLLDRPSIRTTLARLRIAQCARQFKGLTLNQSDRDAPTNVLELARLASVLAASANDIHRRLALQISTFLLEEESTSSGAREAAAHLLERMGAFPSVELARGRELIAQDNGAQLPLFIRLSAARKRIEQGWVLASGKSLRLNPFQKQIEHSTRNADWISFSAPTSAGKSHFLKHWLLDFIAKHRPRLVVYLVPTRALIEQVLDELRSFVLQQKLGDVEITQVPNLGAYNQHQTSIYVLTQERLHLILREAGNTVDIGIMVVDEAQNIGSGSRGILLQQVLEESLSTNPDAKVLFACPNCSNPEIFEADAPTGKPHDSFKSSYSPIFQNLIWASQVRGRPTEWNLQLAHADGTSPLGVFELPSRPAPASKRLPFVAYALGEHVGGNLVYVNRPSDAEKAAQVLYDLRADSEAGNPPAEVEELATFVEKYIHPKYSLAKLLRRGVAYHYGNMPTVLRREVERLFKSNEIRYLVCTSTLLEGVNLPARNIFLRGPKRGNAKPITPSDFWNLGGRAGRLGFEFQGNIVCVDPTTPGVWRNPPPRERVEEAIERQIDSVLNKDEQLLAYLDSLVSDESPQFVDELDYALTYLFSAWRRDSTLKSMIDAGRVSDTVAAAYTRRLEQIDAAIELPSTIVAEHPGINPLGMQRLLAFFKTYDAGLDTLLPSPPESDDAVSLFTAIFTRLSRLFDSQLSTAGVHVRDVDCSVDAWVSNCSDHL